MKSRQLGHDLETSAAKVDISTRSGTRLEKGERNNDTQRYWRTRSDPFEAVWTSHLEPLLLSEPDLTGTMLWEHLDDQFPDQYPEKLLRTLQRRVKHWRATQGPAKPVIFRQSVPAGHQGSPIFPIPAQHLPFQWNPLIICCISFD